MPVLEAVFSGDQPLNCTEYSYGGRAGAAGRTGKLRTDNRENINLLGQFPVDHPIRARL